MAHGNCESMRSRAFTKGRAAFDSDDEYRRALRGELDVREDFSYEANEDPDDGEDPEDLSDDKEDLEDERKNEFFDDTLPGILADRERGAEFLDFVTESGPNFGLSEPEQLWLVRDRAKSEFRLERLGGEDGILTTWDEKEFLDDLREVAWDDLNARNFLLGGDDVKEAWKALDDAWYDEDEDGLVAGSVGEFLADVEDARKDPRTGLVKRDVAVREDADTGRVEMKMVWGRTYPDTAELTLLRDGEKTLGEVPLAFLRWWRFCRERGW